MRCSRPTVRSFVQDVADEIGNTTCQKETLRAYFESQKNVVLLVDELNQLLLKNPADKEAEQRASRFMKDVFLDADGAYMVCTSPHSVHGARLDPVHGGQLR